MTIDPQRQLASLPQAVLLLAPELRIAAANPAAEQLLGRSLRRLEGCKLDEFVRFAEVRLQQGMDQAQGWLSARESEVDIAGQGRRKVDVSLSPIVDQPGWTILTLSEASGAGAMQDWQEGANRQQIRAPEVLAHEIKNPLAGIRGAAQLLGRKLEGRDHALTTLIADEVDRIAKLIDQMQSLSQRTALPLGACNLHEAVRRARSVIEAGRENLTVAEEFDPSLPAVRANADALVQVLLNLLGNAVDATDGLERPEIVVRTRFSSGVLVNRASDGKQVRLPVELRVSDNGPGVDPALRDHIFDPFVSTKMHGQGLGLALVRRLVVDMQGRVAFERDTVTGQSHFRIHLPLAGNGADHPAEEIR